MAMTKRHSRTLEKRPSKALDETPQSREDCTGPDCMRSKCGLSVEEGPDCPPAKTSKTHRQETDLLKSFTTAADCPRPGPGLSADKISENTRSKTVLV